MSEFSSSKLRSSQFIRERLLADPEIKRLVGDAIYPCLAPQTEGDYIVMTRTEYGTLSGKMGVYERKCTVILEIFSDHYDRGLNIAEAVDNHFTVQYEMSLGGDGVSVQLVEAVEAVVDGKYVQLMEYSIN